LSISPFFQKPGGRVPSPVLNKTEPPPWSPWRCFFPVIDSKVLFNLLPRALSPCLCVLLVFFLNPPFPEFFLSGLTLWCWSTNGSLFFFPSRFFCVLLYPKKSVLHRPPSPPPHFWIHLELPFFFMSTPCKSPPPSAFRAR